MSEIVLSQAPQWAMVNAQDSGAIDHFAGGISLGFPRLAIKASRWRVRQGENETVLQEFFIDVVLLDANPNVSKSFYLDAYKPDSNAPPDCSSDDGISPNPGSPKPQAQYCATCPQNVWGSKMTPSGKQAKACADQKHIAVLAATALDGDIYALTLPPASLKGMALYVNTFKGKRQDVRAVVTRLSFDTTADFPLVKFEPVRWLQQHEYETVLGRTADPILPAVLATQPRTGRPVAPTPAPASSVPPIAGTPPAMQPAPQPAAPASAPTPAPAQPFGASAPAPAQPFGVAQTVTPAVGQTPVAATPVSGTVNVPPPALQEDTGAEGGVSLDTLNKVREMLAKQGLKIGG